MRPQQIALTGPLAAAMHGLDGYRDLEWPPLWCVPHDGLGGPNIVRTRAWQPPVTVRGVTVAPIPLLVRHLAAVEFEQADGIAVVDRMELAVEHALRSGGLRASDLKVKGARSKSELALTEIRRRRRDEPATESYAETRALQLLRSDGWAPWRQMQVMQAGRIVHRVDFVIPFRSRRSRPALLYPDDGLLVEIDGRAFHEGAFEEDHDRQSTYDALGFHWVTFTPTQIEHQSTKVLRAVNGAMRRYRPPRARPSPTSQKTIR